MKKRHSIATRIFLLFVLSGGIGVTVLLTNFFTFMQVSSSVEATLEHQLPILTSAANIAHIGGRITTQASNLVSADSVMALNQAESQLVKLFPTLTEMAENGLTSSRSNELLLLIHSLRDITQRLFINSQEKLRLKGLLSQSNRELHWLQVDFVDEVAPLSAESQYNVERLIAGIEEGRALSPDKLSQLSAESNVQTQLLTFEADVNLVLDLLQRVSLFDKRKDVLAAQSMIDEHLFMIAEQREVLKKIPSTITLRQMASSIEAHMTSAENSVERSLRVLILDEQNLLLLKEHRLLIERMKLIIDQTIVNAEQANLSTRDGLTNALDTTRQQLHWAIMAIVAVALSLAWYLKTQILGRLSYVLRSMRHLAQGEQQQMIYVSGKDEVALLAEATNVFNHQSAQLLAYTQTLEKTNTQLVKEIEQRKQTEQELKDTQEGLIQAGKLAVLGQLTTGIVHEFSQPLAAITSNVYLTQQYLKADDLPKAEVKLEKIDTITQRASKLCQHLKSFARKTDDVIQAVPLLKTVKQALELYTEKLEPQWVTISIDEKLQVKANEIRLEQVFVNLIGNSVDATEALAPEKEPEISIVATCMDDQVLVQVRDNGKGIDKTLLPHIFEPFFTTKDVGKGLGLGMSITHNIIHDFGGTIEVASDTTQGTEVSICLKIALY